MPDASMAAIVSPPPMTDFAPRDTAMRDELCDRLRVVRVAVLIQTRRAVPQNEIRLLYIWRNKRD